MNRMKIDKQVINSYPFIVRPLTDDEGSGFIIEYADLPGCVSDGDSPDQAIRHGVLNMEIRSPNRAHLAVNGDSGYRAASTRAWLHVPARRASA
jgi:hypothetical protein